MRVINIKIDIDNVFLTRGNYYNMPGYDILFILYNSTFLICDVLTGTIIQQTCAKNRTKAEFINQINKFKRRNKIDIFNFDVCRAKHILNIAHNAKIFYLYPSNPNLTRLINQYKSI